MEEAVRQKLVDDHFLFVSGDKVSRCRQVLIGLILTICFGEKLIILCPK